MRTIEDVLREINKDLTPLFEDRLRSHLATKDKAWLIEQIVRLTVDARSLEEQDRTRDRRARAARVMRRVERLRAIGLDESALRELVMRYDGYTRERLVAEGLLLADAPPKGSDSIGDSHRSAEGTALLTHTKDVLFGLLFGTARTNTHFERVQQELLALTLPRHKAEALDFMQATTAMSVYGTWHDPESVSHDDDTDNVIFEMEYGEVEGGRIGDAIILMLSLINNLEVNEQNLYARIMDVEQSSLIS